jgi:hypothetical protein
MTRKHFIEGVQVLLTIIFMPVIFTYYIFHLFYLALKDKLDACDFCDNEGLLKGLDLSLEEMEDFYVCSDCRELNNKFKGNGYE